MGHFVTHPRLWKPLVLPFILSLLVSIAFFVLFSSTFGWQKEYFVSKGWPTWASALGVVLLIPVETATCSLLIFLVLFGNLQTDITHKTLDDLGITETLKEKYGVEDLPELSCCRSLGHTLVFLAARIPLLILTVPFNAIPVIGTIMWNLINGWLYSWELVGEFLPMIRLVRIREQWKGNVEPNFCAHMLFGFVAMLLEEIPFLTVIFMGVNACSAAFLLQDMIERSPEATRKKGLLA